MSNWESPKFQLEILARRLNRKMETKASERTVEQHNFIPSNARHKQPTSFMSKQKMVGMMRNRTRTGSDAEISVGRGFGFKKASKKAPSALFIPANSRNGSRELRNTASPSSKGRTGTTPPQEKDKVKGGSKKSPPIPSQNANKAKRDSSQRQRSNTIPTILPNKTQQRHVSRKSSEYSVQSQKSLFSYKSILGLRPKKKNQSVRKAASESETYFTFSDKTVRNRLTCQLFSLILSNTNHSLSTAIQ